LNENEKYYLEDIFQRFIEPHFSVVDYVILFEWDQVSRDYRYVVTPRGDKNKFICFYLHKSNQIDAFEMVIIYTKVGAFNFHNTQKILFLLEHDDVERFNRFLQEFIDDLDEKRLYGSLFDVFSPVFFRKPEKKYTQNINRKHKPKT